MLSQGNQAFGVGVVGEVGVEGAAWCAVFLTGGEKLKLHWTKSILHNAVS